MKTVAIMSLLSLLISPVSASAGVSIDPVSPDFIQAAGEAGGTVVALLILGGLLYFLMRFVDRLNRLSEQHREEIRRISEARINDLKGAYEDQLNNQRAIIDGYEKGFEKGFNKLADKIDQLIAQLPASSAREDGV